MPRYITAIRQAALEQDYLAVNPYDKASPYQPLMRRNGKFYAAGFRNPSLPDDVARCILEAITAPEYRLRWRVGEDAIGYASGRARIADEVWAAMGADMPDEEYNRRMAEYFGIDLR